MGSDRTEEKCLNCQRSQSAIPLISIKFSGMDAWICSQCLPILIHHPDRLAIQLKGDMNLQTLPEDDAVGNE